MWPQYLSCISGVLIFHLVLFFISLFCSRKPAQQNIFTDSNTRLSQLRGYLPSVLLLNNKHTWPKWSVSTDVTETEKRLLGVKCYSNCMIVKNILLFLYYDYDYLIFVIYEATVAMWQKCLKSISFFEKTWSFLLSTCY